MISCLLGPCSPSLSFLIGSVCHRRCYFTTLSCSRRPGCNFHNHPSSRLITLKSCWLRETLKKPLSSLYGALLCANSPKIELLLEIWKEDTPCPEKEGWKDCLEQGPKLIISSRHKLLQVKFLQRVYYTPLKSSWM